MAESFKTEITPSPQQPGVLLIHLLDRCNLRCRHCYIEASTNGHQFLPRNLIVRSLLETERLGIRTVYLTGGEPFLHPDLAAILSSNIPEQLFQCAICTNGTLIGPAEASLLKATHTTAQVSIDGDECYHDAFRGSDGAFRRANRGIQELVSAGVPVTVVVTICQDNLGCLPWLADWAWRMGVQRISVQPLQEVGRGANIQKIRLSQEQMCELFLSLSDLGYRYRERHIHFGLAYRSKNYLMAHPCAAYVCNGEQCHRQVKKEIKTLVIREDGVVLPEVPTLNPRFALGSLFDATLLELVTRYMVHGYEDFHRLCRTVFMDVMPGFQAPIIPWDELISERSWAIEGNP
jgi:MoaA/NifB/PqqE/SkfB family radical SAM enzyme